MHSLTANNARGRAAPDAAAHTNSVSATGQRRGLDPCGGDGVFGLHAVQALCSLPFVQAIPWTVLAVFALGAGTAVWLRVRDAARYQTLGRVVLDEA